MVDRRGQRQEAGAAQLHRPPPRRIPYEDVPHEEIALPDRVFNPEYEREVLPPELYVRENTDPLIEPEV